MIRMATLDDVDGIVELGAAMHRESNYAPLNYHHERTANFIRFLIGEEDGLVAVSDRDGELVGFIMAFASLVWFGDGKQKMACDMGLYVRPANRHGSTAIQLVHFYRDWGVRMGYAQIRAGTNAGPAGQAANAIYQHFGFTPAGQCFVLDCVPKRVGQTFDHHLAVQ